VHAVDLLHAEAVHDAVLHHLGAAAAALFRRLEDDDRGPVEVAGLRQVSGGPEQHRRVAVVAAGVHLARHLRLVGHVRRFKDRQGVHVGPEPDHLAGPGPAAPDHPDDAGPAETGHHLVAAELPESLGDDSGGSVHIEEEFRVLVEILPPGSDLVREVGNAVDDRHRDSVASG
jgi:hypothetical protein